MNRRNLIATTTGFAAGAPLALAAASAQAAAGGGKEFYELRKYELIEGKEKLVEDFICKAAVPAFKRAGVKKVGVLRELEGANPPKKGQEDVVKATMLTVLLAHKNIESVVTLEATLAADKKYLKDGAAVLDAPSKQERAYARITSSLMLAFPRWPILTTPSTDKPGRVLELRIYESHSAEFGRRKVEMFNDAGEIDVFEDAGLPIVFFGQTFAGELMPNLTYMLAFDDMAHHDAAWDVFKKHPGWAKLRANERYKGTVSNITRTFLRALPCSDV